MVDCFLFKRSDLFLFLLSDKKQSNGFVSQFNCFQGLFCRIVTKFWEISGLKLKISEVDQNANWGKNYKQNVNRIPFFSQNIQKSHEREKRISVD
jgi:hypothetical protein